MLNSVNALVITYTLRSAIEHLRVDCFHVVEVIILVRRQYLSIRN